MKVRIKRRKVAKAFEPKKVRCDRGHVHLVYCVGNVVMPYGCTREK